MTMQSNLPRGCTRSRGAADVRHIRALGGNLAQKANRLYMLTVRRESLVNKRVSLQHRLNDIDNQVKEIEADMREIGGDYGKALGRKKKPKIRPGSNGDGGRVVALKY